MEKPVNINLSNNPADAAYTQLVTRLVDVVNGSDTGVALSCLLSLYRACLLSKPNFHEGAKHYLKQLLDELNAPEDDQAPAPKPAPTGAPAAPHAHGYAIELSAEVADIAEKLHSFVTGHAWPHNLVLPALLFIFHETAIAHSCCTAISADLLAEVSAVLRKHSAAKTAPAAEHAGHPIH